MMKRIDFYLAVSSSGRVRALKQFPSLQKNEIAVRFHLELPKRLFEQPVIRAEVKIDEDAVRPVEISPEILISTQDMIQKETGFRVELVPLPIPEKETESIEMLESQN